MRPDSQPLLAFTILVLAISSCCCIRDVGAAKFQGGAVAWHDYRVSVEIDGYVMDPDGRPLQSTKLRLWGSALECEATTDNDGYYLLKGSTRESTCTLYAIHDDPETTGVDLLPEARTVDTSNTVVARVNFTLAPAATVVMAGQLRPVEVSKDVAWYMFKVVDPGTAEVMHSGECALIFGTDMEAESRRLGLNSSTVVVPASRPFAIVVSPTSRYQGKPEPFFWTKPEGSAQRSEFFSEFVIASGEGFTLGGGEVLRIDFEEYSLRSDLGLVGRLAEGMEANITKMEELGFYAASERHELGRSKELIEGVSARLESGEIGGCYLDLRRAYLRLLSVGARLLSMRGVAALSVNGLMVFMSLTSVALATLLTESRPLRFLLSACVYAPMTFYLRLVYPGSGLVAPEWFMGAGVLYFIAVLFIIDVLPEALVRGFGYGGVPGMGTLVSVFSMAKRSLKRRRLRSLLTLSSVLALTMCFVALTSLSTGYGLVYSQTGSRPPDADGIMVRMPRYDPEDQFQNGWFNFMIPSVAEWAEGGEGVVGVAMKAENVPQISPITTIEGWPVRGVLGVQPDGEPLMPMIDGSVVAGEPLKEEGTCLVHVFMLEYAGVEVGDSISVRGVQMRVVGVFDDRIGQVIDMDGEPVLPKYQYVMNPFEERVLWIISATTCDPETVVITTLETALEVPGVERSRIDILLAAKADTDLTGRSMAISREYRFWISSGGMVHLAQMGSWLAGKGLPILVPWAIAVLNVIATMLSSMYERRREIDILSSVGLNPGHIAGVFLGEASIIGIIGGGLGYLLGLGWYPLMAQLAIAPVVGQKVSAVWCLAALGIAVASVVSGSLIALEGSAGLTPSLRRRWAQEGRADSSEGVWETRLPLMLGMEDLEDFVHHLLSCLRAQKEAGATPTISLVRRESLEGEGVEVSFVYNEPQVSLGQYRTVNSIIIAREPPLGRPLFSATLSSKGRREAVNRTGRFVRGLLIRWAAEKGRPH
jgi:hypothetical protein